MTLHVGLAILLIAVPLQFAGLALLVRSDRARPLLLPIAATLHLALTVVAVATRETVAQGVWLQLDALGSVVLLLVSVLFAVCAFYAPAYLWLRIERDNRVFCACLLVFLGMTSLIVLAQHLGLLWVAVEATTLSTAPLLYFNRNARSLEATWKYLMVSSVAIALALLGSFFIAYATFLGGGESSLLFRSLLADASTFSRPWLRAGFVFLLVGYGTKMGLAPLHTWKPDAYGEAPGIVGALLSGGLTSCAFLALLRVTKIVSAAGEAGFVRALLVPVGLVSVLVGAVLMVRQRDFKRMLAYSSVEQMGILVLGVGLGGAGVFGALLHAINNGLTKTVLFLSAGNIHRAYGSKRSDEVSGALKRLPVSGALFLAGFLAITGTPPFGGFYSELTIVRQAVLGGRWGVLTLLVAGLAVVFLGMGATVLPVIQGIPSEAALETPYRDHARKTVPILVAIALVLLLGLVVPAPLRRLLEEAAAGLEAS